MTNRLELREEFRQGKLDKHAYSKAMVLQHAVLNEYMQLLAGSDIARMEIDADSVWVHSKLAPICIALQLSDRGTPAMVSLNFGRYEPEEFEMWQRLIPKGARIADIGANIGWYSAHWAAMDPSARIVAFEPVPTTFDCLRKNIARNGLANVRLEPLGISDQDGTLEFFVDPSIAGAASAHPSVYGQTSTPVTAAVTTLDHYAQEHQLQFDAIKLDVEGGEFAALQGATQILTRDRPIIFIEMLRRHSREFGYHPNDIIAHMKALDFDCFSIQGAKLLAFTHMDEETVETNFFFIHKSKQ